MDIRKETCIIIRKNGQYLVGTVCYCQELRWSENRYDAWRTRGRDKARDVARRTGGIMVLFNPVVGQEQVM